MKNTIIPFVLAALALCVIVFTNSGGFRDESKTASVPKLVEIGEPIVVGGAHYAPDDSEWDGKHMAIILPSKEELVFSMVAGEEVIIREVKTDRIWQYSYYPKKRPLKKWDRRGTLYLHQADSKTPTSYVLSLIWTTQYTGTFEGDCWPNSFKQGVQSKVAGVVEIR
jgi:hypothetical protein